MADEFVEANGELSGAGSNVGLESEPGSGEERVNTTRAEIDTSAPFESVKEAADRFGGRGFWKPSSQKTQEHPSQSGSEIVDIVNMEEEAAQLERELIIKERETLEVLKELETTKNTVEELKSKLQNATAEINAALDAKIDDDKDVNSAMEVGEKAFVNNEMNECEIGNGDSTLCPSSAPSSILQELKQAKLNLTRTTSDLADIRATVDLYNKKIEKERMSLEKTRQRLSSNTSKISALEEELNQTRRKLQMQKDNEGEGGSRDPFDITRELQRLTCEMEKFKKVGEVGKSEVLKAAAEIQQTRTRIKTAEIKLIAAKKMKDAARASEAAALAEIKALSKSENLKKSEGVTISFEEYSSLVSRAREVDEVCNGKIENAMLKVDEANASKNEILKKVEEATEEVKISKKSLEEALSRVEEANSAKLEVEEALRKWRSEHAQKRRSLHNSSRFKNSVGPHHRKEIELKPVLRTTLSIGQILSRKLLLAEDYEKEKVSLGQMLGKHDEDLRCTRNAGKENSGEQLSGKRKKFSFGRISLLATKQSRKKKKQTSGSGCRGVQID